MKLVRFLLAPLLLVALVTSSLYIGVARPGATSALTHKLLQNEPVRDDLARALMDQLIKSDQGLLSGLLLSNRPKAEASISKSLGEPQEQKEIADAAEQFVGAIFSGAPSVSVDPKPIYRPIYKALDEIFPGLNLSQTNLNDLDPIVVGDEEPLMNLHNVRLLLAWSLLLWPIWLVLGWLYVRRSGRRALRSVALQTLIVSAISILVTLLAPILFAQLATSALGQVIARVATAQLASGALLASLVLAAASAAVLLLTRERVVPGEGAAKSE